MLSPPMDDDTHGVKLPPFGLILLFGAFSSLGAMVLEKVPAAAADPELALSQPSATFAEPSLVEATPMPSVTKPSPVPSTPNSSPTPKVNTADLEVLIEEPLEPTPVATVGTLPDGVDRSQPRLIQPIPEYEAGLLERMNAAREEHDLAPLVRNSELNDVALARARNLVDLGYFDHYAPDGTSAFSELAARGLPYYLAGENLARNNYPPAQTVVAAFEGLMASPGHRANILEPRYGAVGVAAIRDGNVWLYVTVFTNPR